MQTLATQETVLFDETISPMLSQQLSFLQWIFVVLIFYFIAITIKYLAFVSWNVVKLLIPGRDLLKRYSSTNKETWAVVTGATDGIGLGFCEQLVYRGFNVCVISRNQQKIDNVVKKLHSFRTQGKSNKIMGLQFDFTKAQDSVQFQRLWQQIEKLDVGMLVNNVGIALIKRYENAEFKQIVDLINVNCVTMACLNARMVKKMKQRPQKSAIINLSSLAGINPIPYITLYSSSKSFNRFISEGLAIQNPKIDISLITPMHVVSAGSKAKKQFNIPTSRQCARDSLNELSCGQKSSFGYLSHRITGTGLLTYLPKWFLRIVSNIEMQNLIKKYHYDDKKQ